MQTAFRLIQLMALTIAMFLCQVGMACTTDAWNGGVTGTPVADSPSNVARVSGLCAMQLSDAGSVIDTSPVAESTLIVRFYVKANLSSGTPVIFEAFSDDAATNGLINITFDGTNFVFNAGSGDSAAIPGKSGWNLVEFSWVSDTGMSFWVNTDSSGAETGSVATTAGTVESVVLGEDAAESFVGTLTFDDYVSHRSTLIGKLLMGDSNNNGSINVFDLISIQNEILGNALAVGQPDCNLSGSVNVFDLICVQNIILGN